MNKVKLVPFSDFKKEALKDPQVKKAYDDLEAEYTLIEAVIRKRLEKGLTQKQLAEKVGTKQSAISRLEGGNANPSFSFLEKIAKALNSSLHISFR